MVLALCYTKSTAQIDPIEVKYRYVKLLSTLVRSEQTQNSLICLFVEKDYIALIDSNSTDTVILDSLESAENCKTAYLSRNSKVSRDAFTKHFQNRATILISDLRNRCASPIDIHLFQKGKRIFFSVNKDRIDAKEVSLSAQVYALAKKDKCSN